LIPAFLRRQRNQRRLTLEMLSAKVGMSPQHLSEIESGKRDPRLSSIERMAEAMGMTVLIKVMGMFTLAIGIQFIVTGVSTILEHIPLNSTV